MKSLFASLLLLLPALLVAQAAEIELAQGLVIRQSCRVKAAVYKIAARPTDLFLPDSTGAVRWDEARAVIVIAGDDLTVDFQQAELQGSPDKFFPNGFYGLGIRVQGRNVTLKNARARGYKVALLAEGADNLRLENCDFSYNYRPKLRSGREREDFSDWLSYHHNERDEWLRYGAGIYLKNCQRPTVQGCRITGNQNALLMTGCNDGLVWNNTFHFNSGLGVGLYRSSHNRLMHNRLDWNVRGYSHHFYQRGQDSAALLVYEQSHQNTFAFNSCTHSGDGFFLWAGQHTMDTGEGGCNDNFIFKNNFSHAPTNGVEVTFSRNRIQGNFITDCTYGIWGGYSYESLILGNYIAACRTGIAIEHGQQDTLRQNIFINDSVGVQLWARPAQPADWGYAQKRDTRSRDAVIDRNLFQKVKKPLHISASEGISVNGRNLFTDFHTLLETPKPNTKLRFWRNDLYAPAAQIAATWQHPELGPQRNLNFSYPDQQPADPYAPLQATFGELREPDSLPGGLNTMLSAGLPRGRQYIVMTPWGPYDFRRPIAVLDTIATDLENRLLYNFVMLGPPGTWTLGKIRGVRAVHQASGKFPARLVLERNPNSPELWLEFSYVGEQPIATEFGDIVPAGEPHSFHYQRFEKKMDWVTQFYNCDDSTDPLKNPEAFAVLKNQKPVTEKSSDELAFAWWDKPADGVQAERFATVSTAEFEVQAGAYIFELTSDDGARLYLDDKLLINNWDVHEPETDEVTVSLTGRHTLRVEHFDAGGFAALAFRMRPMR
jgi:hypothetical protein